MGDVLSLIRCLEKAKICQGHCDSKYTRLVQHRNGKFYDNKGKCGEWCNLYCIHYYFLIHVGMLLALEILLKV